MNIPENVLNIPDNVLNIPENLLNILENVQNCPGNASNISENAQRSSENVPDNSRNIAATSSTQSPLISNQTSGSASLEIATNFSVPTAIPQKTAETLSHRARAQLPVPKNETQSKSTSQVLINYFQILLILWK